MQTQVNKVQETILEQLKISKIHGFPFFAYTGIKSFVVIGDETLSLVKIPKNPNWITEISIFYDYDRDTYIVSFFEDHKEETNKEFQDIYCDGLSEVIAREMGVY